VQIRYSVFSFVLLIAITLVVALSRVFSRRKPEIPATALDTLVQVARGTTAQAVRVTTVPVGEANVPSYVSDGWGLRAPTRQQGSM